MGGGVKVYSGRLNFLGVRVFEDFQENEIKLMEFGYSQWDLFCSVGGGGGGIKVIFFQGD